MEYSRFVAVCFTLNYIIGSGFLTLPWAFLQTGIILGTLVMILFAFLSILSIYLLLETMERATMVAQVDRESSMSILELRRYFTISNDGDGRRVSESNPMANLQLQLGDSKLDDRDTAVRSASLGDVDNPLSIPEASTDSAEMTVSERTAFAKRKFEIPEMCYMFLGKRGIESYTLCATLYLYGTLWAYSSVFGKAFSTYAAVFSGSLYFNYVIYLVFFAVLVVPASLFEFHEQITVQVSLTVFRVIMLVLMISTIAVAHFNRDVEFRHSVSSNDSSNALVFRPENLYILMPIAGYAYVFHHSIPSLAHPVPETHKSSLNMIFSTAILISFVAYVCMAVTVSSYFEEETLSPSNLNWAEYIGRAGDRIVDGPPYYARVVSFFVVLFPAIDVASAYPLNAYTLGNNLMSYYYGENMAQFEKSRFLSGAFRFIAACPPIIAASLVSDLGSITDYTGLAGFAIVFIFPALLARSSARKCDLLGLDKITRFSGFWTGVIFQNLLLAIGTILIIYVGISLIYNSVRQNS